MESAENNKETVVKKPKRRILRKILWTLAILLVVLILAIVFALPAYVSSGSFRKMIIARANASGAGTVDFADLSMSWGKGINVSQISFKDKADGLSVAVKGFSTKPKYGALLSGNLSFGETIIDEPKVEINVEKLKEKPEVGEQRAEDRGKQTEKAAGMPIGRIDLVVKNGDVKIKGKEGEIEVSHINSSVNLRPEGEQSSFDVGARVVGGGSESTIIAKGAVKPGRGWDLKKTTGEVTVDVNNLDLTSVESLLAIAKVDIGAKGIITTNIKASMKQGKVETITGQVKGKDLDITAPQLKGDRLKTSTLDANISAARAGDLMNVEKMTLRTDWLRAEANGTAPMTLATLEDFLKPDSKYELKATLECDVPAIMAQLHHTAGLKEGMRITGGRVVGGVQTLTEAGAKRLSGQVNVEGLAGTLDGKPVSIAEPISAQALISRLRVNR